MVYLLIFQKHPTIILYGSHHIDYIFGKMCLLQELKIHSLEFNVLKTSLKSLFLLKLKLSKKGSQWQY